MISPPKADVTSSLPTCSAGSSPLRAFHIMAKPIGPICNLDCKYCFYLEKENFFEANENFKMSDAVLDTYIKDYIGSQNTPEVTFAWQGGEPTLLGLPYFVKITELQKKYAGGKIISNAIQTNGTRLDDAWCDFFSKNGFLVGLSIDGPAPLHDVYRVDKKQKPTFDQVMRGLHFLKKHGTEFNTLTVVHDANSREPLAVYRFLKEIGSKYMQFIPLVERVADPQQEGNFALAEPAENEQSPCLVTPWSVKAQQYGDFLCAIFDEWVRKDVGQYYVQIFDATLSSWIGAGSPICVFAETCGAALALEHNGDVYSCDHYVYPKYRLGNLMEHPLLAMVNSEQQRSFGNAKSASLPRYCLDCEVRFACHGECPKHRFLKTPDGEFGLNYLCVAYRQFFNYVGPFMQTMGELLHRKQAPATIMQILALSSEKTSSLQ